jgi:hypothetical protein
MFYKNLHPIMYSKIIINNKLLPFIKSFRIDLLGILICLTGSHVNKKKIDGVIDLCVIPSKEENEKEWDSFQKALECKAKEFEKYRVKIWAFPLNRAFLKTEEGFFFNKDLKTHDLFHIPKYIAIFDPSERLQKWKEKLKELPKKAISFLCKDLYYRIIYTPKIKIATKALSFYSERIINLERGIMSNPVMQVNQEPICYIIRSDKGFRTNRKKENLITIKQAIEKWTLKLLPKAVNKKNHIVLKILISQLSIAEYYLTGKVKFNVYNNYSREKGKIISWGEQLNVKWQKYKSNDNIPLWVLPIE